MNQEVDCDLAIIGAGAGGLSLASGASQLGLNVVLIESGKMGGDCLNSGCVPSKSLLAAAKSIYQCEHKARYFGAEFDMKSVDFQKVMAHLKKVIGFIAKNDSVKRFESLGVTVIKAHGKFLETDVLVAKDLRIKAKRFVLATGSSPFVPPIPGVESVPYYTNETIFSLKKLPKELVIVGGGPIGCELAQAFAMLGSRVTILEAFNILPKDEKDCVAIVRDELKAMNIKIYEQSEVKKIQKNGKTGILVMLAKDGVESKVSGTHILIATGRRPNINDMGLEKANVAFSPKGIEVNSRLQSTNKNIYAIGDVASPYQFTHVASYQAGVVLKNIVFKLPAKVSYEAIPWVTYTYPELAHVGKTTADFSDDTQFQVTEWLFQDNDRAQAEFDVSGKIKVLTDKKGKILGVTIVGVHAGELILPWVMALQQKKSLRSFTDIVAPYPSLSEISKQVSGEFYKPKLFSNTTRRLVRWLQKLG
jgi:pyruvate/2-oxoglutarate dehydrogenase complex dihydrolipoamide dehydrogenase (E3) component